LNEPRIPNYSDERFWKKLKRYAAVAGKPVVETALQLYYALQSPKTPKWARTIILGALAYLILPTDAVPDFIPLAGFTDDLGALAAAVATVRMYITDDIKEKARETLKRWFGSTP
jgi:uncharacterized membrane protein YkvA (DUF1232 family)